MATSSPYPTFGKGLSYSTSLGAYPTLSASSSWLSLIVAPIIPWGSFYGQRRPGSTFTIRSDHMRGWITSPRSNLLSNTSWRIFLHSPYCDVYFSRDWTSHWSYASRQPVEKECYCVNSAALGATGISRLKLWCFPHLHRLIIASRGDILPVR